MGGATMTTITIAGPEVTRDDGSVRCIGYGLDSEGRVTGRFALPIEHEWQAPEETESVEYVGSMGDLPSKDDHYRDPP